MRHIDDALATPCFSPNISWAAGARCRNAAISVAGHHIGAARLPSSTEIESSGRTPGELVKMGLKSKWGGEARRLFAIAGILRGASRRAPIRRGKASPTGASSTCGTGAKSGSARNIPSKACAAWSACRASGTCRGAPSIRRPAAPSRRHSAGNPGSWRRHACRRTSIPAKSRSGSGTRPGPGKMACFRDSRCAGKRARPSRETTLRILQPVFGRLPEARNFGRPRLRQGVRGADEPPPRRNFETGHGRGPRAVVPGGGVRRRSRDLEIPNSATLLPPYSAELNSMENVLG